MEEECDNQVLGYKRCSFKGFQKLEDALAYMNRDGGKDSKARVEASTYVDAKTVQTSSHEAFKSVLKICSMVCAETASNSKMEGMRFVLDEDMVHMLGSCYSALNIPDPYYYQREMRCRNKDWGVGVGMV
ncbi:hypothetical protein PIB30_039512 [Stylosanthes scabra]|uniref:Ribonuclease H1 N-terminal domain-containing protein n=1 Tax=Stylosanthes scabra TaxID=79078 RepID=A0ABU6QEV4_9FABA|nr:hypothetical protein [Stylosanthes scabra]